MVIFVNFEVVLKGIRVVLVGEKVNNNMLLCDIEKLIWKFSVLLLYCDIFLKLKKKYCIKGFMV